MLSADTWGIILLYLTVRKLIGAKKITRIIPTRYFPQIRDMARRIRVKSTVRRFRYFLMLILNLLIKRMQ